MNFENYWHLPMYYSWKFLLFLFKFIYISSSHNLFNIIFQKTTFFYILNNVIKYFYKLIYYN